MKLRLAGLTLALLVMSAFSAQSAFASSSGWNDWSCKPTTAHPNPVVLWHGLGADEAEFATIAPALSSSGYCVYSETYGTTYYGPLVGGLAPMAQSAEQLSEFVEGVRSSTGAAQVDIVGHSEGTTVPAYYMKYDGGASKVKRFVGFGANYHGTTLYGLTTLASLLGLGGLLEGGGCGACTDYLPGSAFLTKLDNGPVAVPGPEYTSIMSRYDNVVLPYMSGQLETAPGTSVKNVVLQNYCPLDFVEHLAQAVDPNVLEWIKNSLDPAHARPYVCIPFLA